MVFLTEQDFKIKLSQDILTQILQSDNSILDDAEQQAIAFVKDHLAGLYDIDAELQKTEQERHPSLIRWLMNLSVYFFYERIPDEQVPPRVVKNYDDTRSELDKIARGKLHTTLLPFISNDKPKTVFNWNSAKKRTHNPF